MARHVDGLMLGSIELFCLCAEAGGFTAAARQAGVTPAAASRAIGRLEARLGVRLFTRTTRSVRLTDAGRGYYQQCRQALGQLAEAERELGGHQVAPSGKVRISVPTPIGHVLVLPLLASFRARHPAVELDVHLSNRNVDFSTEDFDLAIRGRDQPDSSLVVRKLMDAALLVVASPAYLAAHGAPRRIDDLARHDCIQFLLPRTGLPVPWRFRTRQGEVEVAVRGGVRCADDLLGSVTLARSGAGLLQTYRFIVADDLAAGRLVEVLPAHAGCTRPFSLVYPGARHVPLRVRLLIDHLVEHMGAAPMAGPDAGQPRTGSSETRRGPSRPRP